MTSLAQAEASLLAAVRPVLFLDTCALLDIVRAPLRDLTLTVQAAIELKTLVKAGTVRLFVQDIVPTEWQNNLAAARRDGEDVVRAFTAAWQIAIPHAAAAGLQYAVSLEASIANLRAAGEIPP